MNLGSPDSTSVRDVRKYLMEFLMDKRVIDYPYLFRKILVGGIIVPFRASKSAEAYRRIWTKEGSPLVAITDKFCRSLSEQIDLPTEISMRYGKPNMATAFTKLAKSNPDLDEILAIPLYPHYAMSSFETAVAWAREIHAREHYPSKIYFTKPFYNNDGYVHALSERIRPYLDKPYDHLLFSYHGIPERHLTKVDPTGNHCLQSINCCETDSPAHATCYRHQCFETTRLVTEQLNIPRKNYSISFQSRLGREQWLRPYTDFRLKEMPGEGIKKLLVVCPSFVSDCLETLEEIDIRGKESFLQAGGESFQKIPCLNDSALWVEVVADWIRAFDQGDHSMILGS